MKSVASAPGKVILFGEHFVVYGISALLCSIDKRIIVTSQTTDEKMIKIESDIDHIEMSNNSLSIMNESTPKTMKPFLYIIKKTLERFKKDVGIEVKIESEIPPGIGLGSSSACCVAAAASITALFEKLSREEILKLAIEAERTIFENTSGADCSVCTFGGLMEYDIKNGFKKINSKADFVLVITNSKQTHQTSELVEKVRKFREKNDLSRLGLLMSENQAYLERIGVSTGTLDVFIKEAKKTAYGAKITGAGGGGCIIALTDKSNLNQTLANLRNCGECFTAKIDYRGLL